ncbi:hypothetical protein N2600_08985 [Rhizobium sp. WSM1274]|uniref:hypothetical protein n=1 Tax=Rhizobium sp. WSM1274 TaxID=3138254 RepID=UPI0021A25BCA|nr:hypothetical protein [Rhizobium leguminosarum]UWU30061.1 hypothetical protein N2600_08985 [Rhizobium leguminosarum bv. viciae]
MNPQKTRACFQVLAALECRRFVAQVAPSAIPYARVIITPAKPPPLADEDVAYIFTDDTAVKFWIDGNIRLNPINFYHTIENQHAVDVREGLGMVHLESSTRFANMLLMSGFNALAICTSCDAPDIGRDFLHAKFGSRLLRINRVTEFTQKIAGMIGAKRFIVRTFLTPISKWSKASAVCLMYLPA